MISVLTTSKKPHMILDGDDMIIHPKNAAKLFGIFIMCFCAVLICTLFLNSNIDMARIQDQITDPDVMFLYETVLSSGRMTSAVTGGALALTTIVMLLFYVKHYIDTHKSELGILKALGYSRWKIASSFWVFGLSVLAGAAVGFACAFALMPSFYREMRSGTILPDTPLHFNPILVVLLVILPAVAFSVLAMLYSYFKLKRPALELIRGRGRVKAKKTKRSDKQSNEIPFLRELKQSTVRSKFSLVFFIWLASFIFSNNMIMSFSMSALGAADMMAYLMMGTGVVLTFTTLIISVATVIRGNTKTIAMLRVFGYSDRECAVAILDGYRPITYFGFAVGALYQHGLMLLMIKLFFGNEIHALPDYSFNFGVAIIMFISFVLLYELFMLLYAKKIKQIPLKEVMQEE